MKESLQQNILSNNRKNKYYIRAIIAAAILLVLIAFELFRSGGYFDEILGVVSILYLVFFINKIERRDATTIMLLLLAVVIGVVSNLISGLVHSVKSIGIDLIIETKIILTFLMMKYFVNDNEKTAIINAFVPLAKLFTVASFICGIISQFTNIGMTTGERYGLKSFKFIFDFNHQYFAVYVLVFGVLVCNTIMKENIRSRYFVIAIIAILFSTKAPALIFTTVFVGLYFYFKNHKRIEPWVIVIGAIAFVFVGWFQINEYLINDETPRRMFFEYGFKTANNYFPLGSGFSTFGSGEAAKNYSPLYYQYGWENKFGMSPTDTAFLNDTYWPSLLGQFGYIGLLLYVVVYFRLFKSIDNKDFSNTRRAFLYGAYLQYMVHAFGSAILSSSAGMIGFMALSLFTVSNPDENKNSGRLKIHF